MTTTTTTTPVADFRKFEDQPFEFILYINNKIICQRFFSVRDFDKDSLQFLDMSEMTNPIRDFNEESFHLNNMKEMIDSICGMNNGDFGQLGILPNFLKEKTKEYLWLNYNPYAESQSKEVRGIYEKIDDFQFEILYNKKAIAKTSFTGNFFPPKVRYAVDIKEIIPSILSEIRYYLSQNNYTKASN